MSGPNYIEHALSDNGIIELRCLGPNTLTGIFDDAEALRQAAQLANRTHNVFSSLNRPSGRPATNTLDTGGGALGNADIERITRIPFDLDPARPTGTNSTSAEMEAGRVQAYALMSYLNSWGWPEPLLACSGNGYHLMYRVKLPADQATADALRIIYLALQSRYTNSQVSFDTSVRNPARIFRLYGTTNRKGPDSAERPQRQSSCYVPSRWDCVARGRFRALAEALTPKPIARPQTSSPQTSRPDRPGGQCGDYTTLDVVALFRSHGAYVGEISAGMHGVRCPWQGEHTSASPRNGSDSVIWEAHSNNGQWPGFHCKHSHCDGRTMLDAIRALGNADQFCSVTLTESANSGGGVYGCR
jgi:hypothetical protein